MHKKIIFLVILSLLVMTFVVGCDQKNPTQGLQSSQNPTTTEPIAWVCPPSVMIEGEIYHDWSMEPVIDPNAITQDQILGNITSVVSITTMPTQDNEANYPNALDAPYARWTHAEYGEVYVIKYGYGWHILLPEGDTIN